MQEGREDGNTGRWLDQIIDCCKNFPRVVVFMHNNDRVIVLLLILDGIIIFAQLRKESVLHFLSLLRSEIELW